jgi:hypothetical protein
MEAYKRIIRSRWLLAFMIVATVIIAAPPLFQTTFDGERYSYYPPFGTIRTDAEWMPPVVLTQSSMSEDRRIDRVGAIKIVISYATRFIVLLVPLFVIRLLLRTSERSTNKLFIFANLTLSFVLTIFLTCATLLVVFTAMPFLGLQS